jgi:hypothetical protein
LVQVLHQEVEVVREVVHHRVVHPVEVAVEVAAALVDREAKMIKQKTRIGKTPMRVFLFMKNG